MSDLDANAILTRVLDAAREVTGARYAALGVLAEDRSGLSQFFSSGVEESTYRAIGEVPKGRGVLGVLVTDSRPLRLRDVGEHPHSYGFPPGHPPMRSFLGVPVMIRGEAWGNLYLADKQNAEEFTDTDEEAVVILAAWAGAAIENARLYERSEQRRKELERAVRGLEATRDIAVAIGAVSGPDRVLELIAKRGRALIDARAVLIMLSEQDELVVAASAGYATDVSGHRLPIDGSTSGEVLRHGRAERIPDVTARLRIAPAELGVPNAHSALLVPMLHRGVGIGVLAAFDRGEHAGAFTEADEKLLETFGASAANAVAIARSVEADRLRSSLAAADAERRHWARELHDDTLQVLGGLRVLLSGALRRGDESRFEPAMREAVDGIEHGIRGLRAIIADLRPAALDEIGLPPAIDALLERHSTDGLEIVSHIELPNPHGSAPLLDPELETAIYRLVQEALTNTIKHAQATSVEVEVIAAGERVTVTVTDNGVGFDTDARTRGYGLAGMKERVYLAGGRLEVSSRPGATTVNASLPIRYRRLREAGGEATRGLV